MDIIECEFKGGHRYSGRVYHRPARLPMQRFDPSDIDMTPSPQRYWEVKYCDRCRYEKKTAHGFNENDSR